MMAGLRKSITGSVSIGGAPVTGPNRRVAVVFSHFGLLPVEDRPAATWPLPPCHLAKTPRAEAEAGSPTRSGPSRLSEP